MDDGGDIAQNLDALYDFMIRQISLANVQNDPEPIDGVIDILREIKSAWDQIPPEFHHVAETQPS